MIVCMYVVYIAQSSSSSFQHTYNIFSNALSLCMRECFFLWLFGCRFLYLKSIKTDIISLWPPLINSQRLHRWQVPLVGFATTILWQSFDLAHLFTVLNCCCFAAVKVLLLFCVALTLCDSNRLLLALAPNKNRPRSVMKEKNSLLIRPFYCSSWCMFVRLLKRR